MSWKIKFSPGEVLGLREIPIVIRFNPDLQDQVESLITRLGGAIRSKSRITSIITATIPAGAQTSLAQHTGVLEIWRDVTFGLFQRIMPYYPSATPGLVEVSLEETVRHIGADELHNLGYSGRDVRVSVIDTGVAFNPMVGDVLYEASFVPREGPEDLCGHGTACGSVVRAVAPGVELVNAKAFDHTGSSTFTQIMEAAEWSVLDAKAEILNMSFGSLIHLPALNQLLQEMRERHGVLPVAAGGNSGPSLGTIGCPADGAETVAVAAIAVKSPRPNAVAGFSSRGPSIATAQLKPDLAAPGGSEGEAIVTAWLDGVKPVRGTSFSAPHVVGALSLLKEAFPDQPLSFYPDRLYRCAQ